MRISKSFSVITLTVSLIFSQINVDGQITEKEQKRWNRLSVLAGQHNVKYLYVTIMAVTQESQTRWSAFLETELKRRDLSAMDKVTIHLHIGKFQRTRGNYYKALKHFSTGIELFRQSQFKKVLVASDGTSVLDIFDEAGMLYADIRDYNEAENYLRESIKFRQEYLGKQDMSLAVSYANLGNMYYELKEQEESAENYELSKKVMLNGTSTGGIRPGATFTTTYYGLARSYYELGELSNVIKNAKYGVRYGSGAPTNKAYGAFPMGVARCHNLMAMTYIKLNDLKNALKSLDRADQVYKENFSTELNAYTEILRTRALISWLKGDYIDAHTSLEEMMQNHIEFINENFVSLSDKEKQDFYERIREDQNLYFDYSIRLFQQTGNIEVITSLLDRRLSTKGFILNDQTKIMNAIKNSSDLTLKRTMSQWQEAKEELSYTMYNEPASTRIDSLRQVINSYEKFLSESSTGLIKGRKMTNWQDVQKALSADEIGLEVIAYPSGDQAKFAFIYIYPTAPPQVTVQSHPEGKVASIVNYYRNAIQYETPGLELYKMMWKDVDMKINNISKVYFSPDGIFHQVNINTIQKEKDRYVIDDYQVINLTSLKDIATASKVKEDHSKNAVLVGRPQYDFDMQLADISTDEVYRSNMALEFAGFRDQKFSDLIGTEIEITSVSTTLKSIGWNTNLTYGANATEQYIKTLKSPGILHIATHGFFLSSDYGINPMMKSGLVMAGVNNTNASLDDGILTAYEATNLELDKTWLVVLSACETGLGDLKNGEGVFGLQRALTVAGADNLLMTLWKVDDTATQKLMTLFYEKLDSSFDITDAFRESQLELRKEYPHPKYWGPFVMVMSRN